MASVVGHELRNALAGIGSAVEVLGRNYPEDSEERLAVEEIRRRIGSVSRMTRGLARLAPGQGLRRSSISVRGLIDVLVRSLDGARIRALADPKATLFCDTEVLSNALAQLASALEPPLELSAHRKENGIELCIEGARRCAERPLPGFSTDRDRSVELGRALARLVIEAHGGELDDEAASAGAPAVIAVRLPFG